MKLAIALIVMLGCVDQGAGPQGKKIDPSYIQSHLLAAVPAEPGQEIERFDVKVGDVAIYLGNKVDKPRVAPGQPVAITHYWKILKSPGSAWRVFTLVRGAAGSPDFMNVPPSDMQLGHGPATWEPGEIIEDVQTIYMRPDWRSKEATVLVGLIEHGKHGTLDRMDASGPKTLDRAIVARVLEIDLSRAPPPKGTAHVPRAQGAITIDGVANDPGWAGAATADLVAAEGSAEPIGKAVAKMTWDDQFLYVHVAITDSDIVSPFKQQDDPLWKGDCIEVFIDADSNRRGYVELQANPLGITFDSWFAETRAKPGDEAWDSSMVAAAKLRGSVEASDSGDQGWDVELGIPWAAVKGGAGDAMKVETPPVVGSRWRMNIVRVDRKSGTKPNEMTAASWNRITMADFHALDRMLTVVFADQTGSIVPQAAPSGSGSAEAGSAAVGSGASPAGTTITVEVPVAGNVIVDGRALDDNALELALRGVLARDRQAQLVVKPAKGVAVERITAVIDRAKRLGITQITTQAPGTQVMLAPGGQNTPAAGPGQVIVVEVAISGGVVVNGKAQTDAELDKLFSDALARDKDTQVTVMAPKDVANARIVAVVDRAKQRGLTKIAIATGANRDAITSNVAVTPIDPKVLSLIVELPPTGDMTVGGKSIKDADVDNLFRAAFARDKQTQVIVKPDKATAHARVIDVMERAKRAGLTRLAIATK